MKPSYKRPFAQYVKKAHKPLRQEYLVAYRPPGKDSPLEFLIIDFYQVGSHENFYDELKHCLRQESSKGETK